MTEHLPQIEKMNETQYKSMKAIDEEVESASRGLDAGDDTGEFDILYSSALKEQLHQEDQTQLFYSAHKDDLHEIALREAERQGIEINTKE